MKRIRINATGCSLVDTIINGVNFSAKAIKPYLSTQKGDGGLSPGELVFRENLELYAEKTLDQIIQDINIQNCLIKKNIGGPAIVAIISAAQMLYNKGASFQFFQNYGDDENGTYLLNNLNRFAPSVKTDFYNQIKGNTAETTVLSDPSYYNNHGERTFINSIGTAGDYSSESLNDNFFAGDILVFGATALTPSIHEDLTELLKKGKLAEKINIVTTVFDFLNENRSPDKRWPLGNSTASYSFTDLLITDYIEALRLSGKSTLDKAIEQFKRWGLKALIVTNGTDPVTYYASEDSLLFTKEKTQIITVPNLIPMNIKGPKILEGDTTGCGDNFAGGVISSIIMQFMKNHSKLDLREAVILGNCTGASACFHLGGMLREKAAGEKLHIVEQIYKNYKEHL